MNAKIIAIVIILINNFKFCQCKSYVNYSLFNAIPTEMDHLKFLQDLDSHKYIDLIFWKKPYKLNENVQFIVNPIDTEFFNERAYFYKLKTDLLMKNVQSAFDDQRIRRYYRLRVDSFSWEAYHTLEDIYQWLADIALKYANIVELISIGKSAEGREIYVMCIKKSTTKQRIIVEGGIHGHEWIAIEFVTYLTDQLIRSYLTKNWQLKKLVDRYEWYLIPIVNPDGFLYSQQSDRLWRKNRRPIGNSIGVDLNRNFDYNFGKFGTTKNVNDDHYCGPHAFSEPESQTLSNFITKMRYGLKYYFSFHSYGQKIIIPYADKIKHIDNSGETELFGKQAIIKIQEVSGTKFTIGTIYDTMGPRISGNSANYIKKTHNVRYVYTFLLRDNGSYGYALPAEQILPTCLETVSGIKHLMTAKHKKVKVHLFSKAEYYAVPTFILVVPVNENDVIFLSTLDMIYDVNFWKVPSNIHMSVDFVMNPKDQLDFIRRAKEQNLYLTTIIEDVQSAFNQQKVQKYVRRKMTSMNWENYFRLDDIYNWLEDLAKAFPKEVKLFEIGKSHENRSILAVKLVPKNCQNRSIVIIEGGIHAREWITPAVVTYLINSIVHSSSSDNPGLRLIAQTYEWYFVPVLNPDGYEYTHTNDRLWRKNRNGLGVDLNRNFDVAFGTKGVSWFQSSESYCGPRAFSESETKAMSSFIRSKSEKLEYYVAFHSYGQYMILPYGHMKEHTENYNEVYAACEDAAKSIKIKYDTRYFIGTPYETVGYLTSGVSGCWVKNTFKVRYVVTFELRDTGKEGFALPPKDILPTCEETLDGLISFFTPRTANFTAMIKIQNNSVKSYQVLEYTTIIYNVFFLFILYLK